MEESEQSAEMTASEDTQSEEQTLDQTSSEESDTTSEETIETPEVKKPSRAQERIREVIQERNYWKQQAQTKQASQTPDYEGVSDDGIDPIKFGQSVTNRATQEATAAAQVQIQALKAEQDFPELKTSRVFQGLAAGYVSQGLSPYDAAVAANEDYQAEITATREKAAKKVQADKTLKSSTYTPSGQQNKSQSGTFTREEIAKMSIGEYEKNANIIQKQLEKGLIQ